VGGKEVKVSARKDIIHRHTKQKIGKKDQPA
jgi:hypothetical protein